MNGMCQTTSDLSVSETYCLVDMGMVGGGGGRRYGAIEGRTRSSCGQVGLIQRRGNTVRLERDFGRNLFIFALNGAPSRIG